MSLAGRAVRRGLVAAARAHLFVLLLALSFPLSGQQDRQFGETMDVVRYLLTVRATGAGGEVVRDLRPEEFIVTIDGKRAEVEAADWIGGGSAAAPEPTAERPPIAGGTAIAPVPSANRFIVFFVQTDFGRASLRLRGQMNFNAVAGQLVNIFGEGDRIAVVSHDSQLKLRLDFTSDKDRVVDAVRKAIFVREPSAVAPSESEVSLLPLLDSASMKRAATGEAALLIVSEAFARIEGEKLLVLAGWGFGDWVSGTPWVFYEPEWPAAIRTLQSHRIPVISLGTGTGGQLTTGLVSVAEQTGGFYAGTQVLVHQSLQKADSFLEGRYELVLRISSPLTEGEHQIKASASRRGTSLIAPAKVIVIPQNRPEPVEAVEPSEKPSPAELYAAAMQLLLDGEAEEAERLLTELLDLAPSHADGWFERGMLRAARDDRVGAASDLRRYLQLVPRGARAEDAQAFLDALE